MRMEFSDQAVLQAREELEQIHSFRIPGNVLELPDEPIPMDMFLRYAELHQLRSRVTAKGLLELGKIFYWSRTSSRLRLLNNRNQIVAPSLRVMAEWITIKTGYHVSKDALTLLEAGQTNITYQLLIVMESAGYVLHPRTNQLMSFMDMSDVILNADPLRHLPLSRSISTKDGFTGEGLFRLACVVSWTRQRLATKERLCDPLYHYQLTERVCAETGLVVPYEFFEALEDGTAITKIKTGRGIFSPNKIAQYFMAMGESKLFQPVPRKGYSRKPLTTDQIIELGRTEAGRISP